MPPKPPPGPRPKPPPPPPPRGPPPGGPPPGGPPPCAPLLLPTSGPKPNVFASRRLLNLRLAKTFGSGPEVGSKSGAQGGGPPGGGPPGGGPRGGGGGGGFGRGPGGGFGGMGAASTRRYNLTFSVNARNVLNKVNAATPNGTLTSPNFGQSTALAGGPFSSMAANRKIELQAMFSF